MLTRYDPFEDLFQLHNQLFGPRARPANDRFLPAVDVYEDDQGLVFEAELPGVRMEDVELELEKDVLTLRGERKLERKSGDEGSWRVERRYGRFERAFRLPDAVDASTAQAEMKDGVLAVRFEKKKELKPRKIAINGGEKLEVKEAKAA